MSGSTRKQRSYVDIVAQLVQESKTRPVIPFLGAGISISAGFPAIKSVVEYLAKVDFVIHYGVYSYRYPSLQSGRKDASQVYREHPARFLRDFGWPKLGQIDSDLWEWLERGGSNDGERPLQGHGRVAVYDADHDRKAERQAKPVILSDQLSQDICWQDGKNNNCLDLRDHLRAIAQWSLRRDLVLRESGTAKSALREWLRWKTWYSEGMLDDTRRPELLYGDWESLLDRLCEGDFDLIDALFTSFEEHRSPTTAHRFVTFLHNALDMPVILTTNFDSLLEQAFIEFGTNPKVFDVHRDATLPDADLVARRFSILKLHGSAYGLRLGERLRTPLEVDAQHDILSYLPFDSVIVVVGFSGGERRIMQLLHAIAKADDRRDQTRIMWFRGPGTMSPQLSQLKYECRESLTVCQISDAAAFLQDWYFRFANGYQSSPKGYEALGGRPLRSRFSNEQNGIASGLYTKRDDLRKERAALRRPVQIFATEAARIPTKGNTPSSSAATLQAAEFVAKLGYEYNPIWIDLESHHTVSGIVAELFENFRKYDPEAPQFTMLDTITKDGRGNAVIDKAVERIREVLARGRYVIVLDSLESFGRPQMMHHGIPSYDVFQQSASDHGDAWRSIFEHLTTIFEQRVDALKQFLERLFGWRHDGKQDFILKEFRDTYILLTADKPRLRNNSDLGHHKKSLQKMQWLVRFFAAPKTLPHHINMPSFDSTTPQFILDETKCWIPSNFYQREIKDVGSIVCDQIAAVVSLKCHLGGTTLDLDPPLSDASRQDNLLEPTLAVLSIFRRPRSLPMIRSITERWILSERDLCRKTASIPRAHKNVDYVLDTLASRDAIVMHEGGRVRMMRHVHETIYGALTASSHIGTTIREWSEQFSHEYERRGYGIGSKLLAASLHFAAARTCFVDVFLPTRDIQAFYEYLYHRVAVLKLLTLLLALVRLPTGAITTGHRRTLTVPSLVIKALSTLSREVVSRVASKGCDFTSDDPMSGNTPVYNLLCLLGFGDVVPVPQDTDDATKFTEYLQALRLHALQTLSLAIKRNFETLRQASTPDTMLSWTQQFLEREVMDVNGSVFEILRSAKLSVTCIQESVGLNEECSKALNTLTEVFRSLQSKSQYAKLDYMSAIDTFATLVQRTYSPDTVPQKESSTERADRIYAKAEVCIDLCERRLIPPKPARQPKNFQKPYKDKGDANFEDDNPLQQLRNYFAFCRALVHMGWDGLSENFLNNIEEQVKQLSASPDFSEQIQARRLLRDIFELQAKISLQKAMHPWHGLSAEWEFDAGSTNRSAEARAQLERAERRAIEYETLLRETSTSNEKDVRHRSSAYVLRARANYLQGRFSRAHHYLDLANAGGTDSDHASYALAKAEIHMAQAALLIYSAHCHCERMTKKRREAKEQKVADDEAQGTSGGDHRPHDDLVGVAGAWNEVSKEVSKIRRAEREMSRAAKYMDIVPHQTEWWIRFNLGSAQVCCERLLFDIEMLTRNRRRLTEAEYSRNAGALEQSVQRGMKHLRSALDLIPYEVGSWDTVSQCKTLRTCPLFLSEQQVYALWIRYYIVTRFYWTVLQMRHQSFSDESTARERGAMIEEVITRVNGGDFGTGEDTWRMWCQALRFGKLAEVPVRQWLRDAIDQTRRSGTQLTNKESSAAIKFSQADSVVPLRDTILYFCRALCTEIAITKMWNQRRDLK